MARKHWFMSGSGTVDLCMTAEQARGASHQGQCDADVEALSREPAIAKQLAALDPVLLAADLREYGAWDAVELADHKQNLQRILWIAAGGIREDLYEQARG